MPPTKKGRASKAPSISDDDPDAEVAEPIPSESDDSGSEFDPIEDSESDFVVETDEDDEEVMVKAAVKQSIRTAREDQERAAGLTSAGAGSSKSRASANKAAAMRAAAAERRLARQHRRASARRAMWRRLGEDGSRRRSRRIGSNSRS